MKKPLLPDLWHLEKPLTVLAMLACIGLIFAVFVVASGNIGLIWALMIAAVMIAAASWLVVRFIPLSEYRRRSR